MMKKSGFEKMVLQKNKNKGNSYEDEKRRGEKFLVSINIMGSAGPIRFVVKEKDLVSVVIDTALKSYAREGRLPVLGFDATNFLLYCANAGFDGLPNFHEILDVNRSLDEVEERRGKERGRRLELLDVSIGQYISRRTPRLVYIQRTFDHQRTR